MHQPPTLGPGSHLGARASFLKYPEHGSLAGMTCVITGANSGIGYETALYMAHHGADVVLAVRNQEKGQQAVKEILADSKISSTQLSVRNLDLASLKSVRAFAEQWGDSKIDMLILNAGIVNIEVSLTEDGFENTYQTNHLSQWLLARLLLPALAKSDHPKIVPVTSFSAFNGKIDFDTYNLGLASGWGRFKRFGTGMQMYANSKLFNMLCLVEFDQRLHNETGNAKGYDKIVMQTAHPGMVASGMSSKEHYKLSGVVTWIVSAVLRVIGRSPKTGAMPTIYAALAPETASVESSGQVWADCISCKWPEQTQDGELRKKAWSLSCKDAGVPEEL